MDIINEITNSNRTIVVNIPPHHLDTNPQIEEMERSLRAAVRSDSIFQFDSPRAVLTTALDRNPRLDRASLIIDQSATVAGIPLGETTRMVQELNEAIQELRFRLGNLESENRGLRTMINLLQSR